MSDQVILRAMLVIVAALNVYGLVIMRSIHRITNETLLKVDVALDLKKR